MQRSLGNFDMGTTQYQYWLLQVSIFGKFPKMPNEMLKYWQILWPLSKCHLFPSLGTATHIICVAIWEISTISPIFLAHWQ